MDTDRMRTTERNVTFSFPFTLPDLGRTFPAGTYRIVTDERVLTGSMVDLPAAGQVYSRVAAMLMLPAVNVASGSPEILWIELTDLEIALAADRATPRMEAAPHEDEMVIVPGRLGVLQRLRNRVWRS